MSKIAKVKTKFEKNKIDDERRKLSLKEKIKAKENQQNLIKNALLNIDAVATSKKKKFESDDSEEECVTSKKEETSVADSKKLILFNDSDGDYEDDTNLNVKEQFKGKEGLKLLSLQSTYGDDSRFKIDKRFIENDESNEPGKFVKPVNGEDNDNICDEEEKKRQWQILGDVLGHPVESNESVKKKDKKRTFDMIRYDESNIEHSKFVIQPEEPSKKKEKKSKREVETNSTSKPVSKEKFYEVSSALKNAFESSSKSTGFSLLKTLGRNPADDDNSSKSNFLNGRQFNKNVTSSNTNHEKLEQKNEVLNAKVKKSKKYNLSDLKAFKGEEDNGRDSSSSDSDGNDNDFNFGKESNNVQKDNFMNNSKNESLSNGTKKKEMRNKRDIKKDSATQSGWKETFFFQKDDIRYKEGLDFMNKKNSAEAKSAQEALDTNRGKLREVFRTNLRKHAQNKNPFKKKVGGMKIKPKYLNSKKNKPANRIPGR